MALGKLGKAFNRFGAGRTARAKERKPARRAAARFDQRRHLFETLEDRCLLSVSPSYEPQHYFESRSGGTFSEPSTGAPLAIALQYLTSHASAYGLEVDDVSNLEVTDNYTDDDTGVSHIYLQQTFHDVEVVNTTLVINIAADGSVLNVAGDLVSGLAALEAAAPATSPVVSARTALELAGAELGLGQESTIRQIDAEGLGLEQVLTFEDADLSTDSVTASLHYVATADGVHLAWNAQLQPSTGEVFDVSVDTASGELLRGDNLASYATATYRALGQGAESPDDPDVSPDLWVSSTIWGTRDASTNLPTLTDSTDPSSAIASPYGWHDTNGVAGRETSNTSGNNAITSPLATGSAQSTDLADTDTNLAFYDRAVTAPRRPTTNYTLDLSREPTAYTNASVTNAFYWVNLLHDIHYVYGFDEASGNFQNTNYTGLGAGADRVTVMVQYVPDDADGDPIYNYTFMNTPADGSAPVLYLGIYSYTSPRRDAALDNELIIHEYGHGVTSRLVGGPANSGSLTGDQSSGMSEGWSDFWALMFTQQSTDTQAASYPVGTYVKGEVSGSGNGLRTYPYSYDMTVDPVTYGSYNQSGGDEYKVGEIWASTLWDLNWLLCDKYGFSADLGDGYTGEDSAGNQLMLQLVTDSLKLLPANPTLIDGRDAMLLADQTRTGGANQQEIWQAFARRGMGLYAYDGGGTNASSVTEDFTRPPEDPFVTATTPNAEVASLSFMDFSFSEAMDKASFSVAQDVTTFTGPGGVDLKASLASQMSYTWLDNSTLRVSFPRQDVAGNYTLAIGPQILSADTGQAMDQDYDGTPGEASVDAMSVTTSVVPDSFGYQAVAYPYEDNTLLSSVDQGQELTDTGFTLSNTTATLRWQEFVPTETSLRTVAVNLTRVGSPGTIVLSIYDASGNQVWSQNLAQGNVLLGQNWVDVNLSTAVTLVPGNTYQLRLATQTAAGASYYTWNGKLNTNAYPLGVADTSAAYPGFDYAFRVYGTSATTLTIGRDDGVATIPLGTNTFRFYGSEFTGANQLYVYTNGLITLGGSQFSSTDTNGSLRSNPEWPTIAAYWDNLYMARLAALANASSVISYEFDGDRLIIEWGLMAPYGYQPVDNSLREGETITFQTILQLNTGTNTGTVIFNYVDLGAGPTSNGAGATVGVKDYGITGTHRIVVSQDDATNPYIGTGKAVMIVEGGTIAGRVYNDADGDGTQDAGEAGISGWGVYLDQNRNGQYDATDVLATTDAAGDYVFQYLPWGDYVIRQVNRLGWIATAPTDLAYESTLRSGLDVSGITFGDQYVNTAPTIADQSFPTLPENSAAGTSVGWIVATDADLPAQSLTYTVVSGNGTGTGAFAVNPTTGQITVADPAQLDFETTPTFNLMVQVTDSVNPSLSASANIAIRLTNVNELPVTANDTYYVPSGTSLSVAAPGLLANDKDPEGASLTVTVTPVVAPTGGSLTVSSNGAFTYQPNVGTTDDAFQYEVTDAGGAKSTAWAYIHVVRSVIVELSLNPVWESVGVYAGIGTLRVDNALASDLIVSLTTVNVATGLADSTEIAVPATVTLPAGQTSVTFNVTTLDDTAEDGTQQIKILANATGFAQGETQVAVRDNDLSYFYIAPVSNPQVANVPFLVEVEARDASGLKIDIYGGAGFFTANVNNVNIAGVTWENYVPSGEDPPEQAFENGSGSFLVTIPTLQTEVQLVVADSLAISSHKGYSNRFDITYGSVSRFQVGSIISPQYQTTDTDTNSFVLTATALDASGFKVVSYNGAPEVTAWTARQSTASSIVISEIGDGSPDFFEIQNVTDAAVSTKGWTVLINDPTNADPTAVVAQQWALPDSIAARGMDYRSDDAADASHYWGANIPWGASTPQGWVMIIDDQFQVRDFVAWGYDEYSIKALEIDVGATLVRVYDPDHPDATEWFDAGVTYGGTASKTLQRVANRDGNAATDFNWLASSFQQTNPSLVLPFAAPVRPVEMTPHSLQNFTNGQYSGGVQVTELALQVFLRVSDGQGHIGESNNFDVQVAPVPTSVSTPGAYDPSSSTFYLKNSNGSGFANNVFGYGPAPSEWIPISGDWNGDGWDTVGLYDPASSTFYLTNSNTGMADVIFGFGAPGAGWKPVAGDWNGDGVDTVGLYDSFNAMFYLSDSNSTGIANKLIGYGPTKNGWTPVAGNWDGKGGDGIGLYSPGDALFYLKNDANWGMADMTFGFGGANWSPIVGDWDANGADSIGAYDPQTAMFYERNTNNSGYADTAFGYGMPNGTWKAVVGDWNGPIALTAAVEPVDVVADVAAARLDAAQVESLATVALEQWTTLGLSSALAERLSEVRYVVTDLPGAELGRVQGQTVFLDTDAAGRGWFVDATPDVDEEFTSAGTAVDAAALDRIDLLTVVAHELGHVAGLEHLAGEDALMAETLPRGVRRTAGLAERDALFAEGLAES